MLFNSFNFIIYFLIVVTLYYILPYKAGIYMLLAASYIFYMWWNPALIFIIVFVTFINFALAAAIYKKHDKVYKKRYLILAVLLNFGILFFFKYLTFACGSVNSVAQYLGSSWRVAVPDIVLPMGISFYTFQAAAYTIDVYRERLKPSKSYVKFSLFITFFPQLVAGPIERSKNLLGQFNHKNRFKMENVLSGLEIMLIGYFKKVVIADRLSVAVNTVFNNCTAYGGLYYIVAVIMFTIQIYCDFSGYSDIARGAARVLGFKLMINFNTPFAAKSIREYWRRWHISLSSWFMDYVYIPLGGNRKGRLIKYRNLMITFLVSGLWHGANWTFVIWGALHGAMLVIEDILRTEIKKFKRMYNIHTGIIFDITSGILATLITFGLVAFAFILFRANTISDAGYILSHIFWDFRKWFTAQYLYELFTNIGLTLYELKVVAIAVVVLLLSEGLCGGPNVSVVMRKRGIVVEVLYFAFILLFILTAGVFYNAGEFIYFQF